MLWGEGAGLTCKGRDLDGRGVAWAEVKFQRAGARRREEQEKLHEGEGQKTDFEAVGGLIITL